MQNQGTSTNSSSGTDPSGFGISEAAPTQKFETKKYVHFEVDYGVVEDSDFVYQFWPSNRKPSFVQGFAKALEDGFKEVCPKGANVEAGFYDLVDVETEARVGGTRILRPGETSETCERPLQETFWVRVRDMANAPLADVYLEDRVFQNIERRVSA